MGARSRAAALDRARGSRSPDQRAAGMVELVSHRGVALEVSRVSGRVALAVGEVRAHEDRHVLVLSAIDGAGGGRRAKGAQVAEIGLVVVAVVVVAVVAVDPDAFIVRVELEVDDARDRIRAVDRGRAAGQHVHALDQVRRDLVDVRGVGVAARHTARTAGIQTPVVDQHQGALRAETPQADGGDADRADRHPRALLGGYLRQGVEQVLNAHQAGLLDIERRDARHGADGDVVRCLHQA